jgi:P2-related tail formation protein
MALEICVRTLLVHDHQTDARLFPWLSWNHHMANRMAAAASRARCKKLHALRRAR